MGEKEPYRPGLVRNRKLVDELKELQRNPRSLIFVSLADSYRQEGLPHQALEILEEGLAFHPGLASALISKARSLYDLRRYGEASSVCREVLQANPDNIKAYKLQAEIFVRLGQRKSAIRALTKVVSLFPQDREAAKALEELENLESKLIIPPEKISRASVDTPPTIGRLEEFQVESFRETLAAIPKEDPPSAPIVFADPEKALEAWEEEAGTEPTFATRTIAELYLRQGLRQKAAKVLKKILTEDPGNSWARETLQDLGTSGIVAPAQKSEVDQRRAALKAQAQTLERLLALVRLRKSGLSGA